MTPDTGAFRYVLRAVRRAQGLDPDELARRAGLSRAAVTHLERGIRSPSYATACALADALGIGVDGFREGPNQRPVETGRLRDARLAALQEWHRWEAEARRQRVQEICPPSPVPSPQTEADWGEVDKRTLALSPFSVNERVVCNTEKARAARQGQSEVQAAHRGLDAVEAVRRAAVPAAAAPPASELVEDLAHVLDLGEPAGRTPDLAEQLGQAVELAAEACPALELAEQLPPGELTAQLLKDKAELHPLDKGDRKAFHQARRRANKAGQHSIEAVVAGYAAVRRHREKTRTAEKPPARIAQDRRSRSRPAQGPAENATGRKGRYRGRQD